MSYNCKGINQGTTLKHRLQTTLADMSLHLTLRASHVRGKRTFATLSAQRAMQSKLFRQVVGLQPAAPRTISQKVRASLLPVDPVLDPAAFIAVLQSRTDLIFARTPCVCVTRARVCYRTSRLSYETRIIGKAHCQTCPRKL